MERVAPATLIQAAADLQPADRALLNLWMARGLPDAELAAMAGVSPAAVTTRKLDIVELLSTQLGVPPYAIVAALSSTRALSPSASAASTRFRTARSRIITGPEPRPRSLATPRPRRERSPRPRAVPRRPATVPPAPMPPVPAVRLRTGAKTLAEVSARRSSARGGHGARRDRHAPAWLRPLPEPAG